MKIIEHKKGYKIECFAILRKYKISISGHLAYIKDLSNRIRCHY